MLVDEPKYRRLTLAFEMPYMIGVPDPWEVRRALWGADWVYGGGGVVVAGGKPDRGRVVSEAGPCVCDGDLQSGTNVAAMVGPPVFAYLVAGFGWQGCFLVTGSMGFVWKVIW